MRLLNTTTFILKEFFGVNIPEYAILSHTWGEEEVLFKDIEESTGRNKKGFSKVKGICGLAECSGFEWVWIDTCCINKSSSSELSEAINSMYKWYANAHTCYVYLADVHQCISQFPIQQHQEEEAIDKLNFTSHETPEIIEFKNSRWFSRGWTLQELIAPRSVEFYTSNWEFFGTKGTLAHTISKVTGIGRSVLTSDVLPSQYSVAEKMSWASKRSTTREEDMAYSLIGLFQINMPLLYGEGHRAFIRLQDEILKNKEDYTLFAWVAPPVTYYHPYDTHYSGLLAPSPFYFSDNPDAGEFASRQLQNNLDSPSWEPTPDRFLKTIVVGTTETSLAEPPIWTAKGIRLSLPMIEDPHSNDLLAYIHCRSRDKSGDGILCLVLRLKYGSGRIAKKGIYQRSMFNEGLRWLNYRDMKTTFTYKTVYVEGVARDITRPHLVHGINIWERLQDNGILIFGKPDTNAGLTAQIQILDKRIYAFEIVHPHAKFFVGLSTLAKCKILPHKTMEVMRDHCMRLSSAESLKEWGQSSRSSDTISLGESSWINVLAKVAPKTWIHKHRAECARKEWEFETGGRVILLYVWADRPLEYVSACDFSD